MACTLYTGAWVAADNAATLGSRHWREAVVIKKEGRRRKEKRREKRREITVNMRTSPFSPLFSHFSQLHH
jgi:malate synthase